jgi:hypothetical protein
MDISLPELWLDEAKVSQDTIMGFVHPQRDRPAWSIAFAC